jgi:hypothetical protein
MKTSLLCEIEQRAGRTKKRKEISDYKKKDFLLPLLLSSRRKIF